MSTPAVTPDIQNQAQPAQPPGVQRPETTKDAPLEGKTAKQQQLTEAEQQELIALVRKYKLQWFLARRAYLKRVLKAHEFLKGNHFISFDPESFQWFDAIEEAFAEADSRSQDVNLYQFATNFYQMLALAFVGALSQQTPKSRFLPDNAEVYEDIRMAKNSSTVQEIIERKNDIKTLHRMALLELWLSGCYFRHTRFVIDKAKAGTHPEPIIEPQRQQILPARYLCFNCGKTTPADQVESPLVTSKSQCPNCGNNLYGESYFPAEYMDDVPTQVGTKDVANGIVKMDIWGPLNVDCNPRAQDLSQTEILNLEVDVSVATLRTMYPEKWQAIRSSGDGLSPDNQQEKLGRALVFSETGSRSQFMMEQLPTYSRTWIQPWAFNEMDDKAKADKFKQMFPDGCLLCNVGNTFLEARNADMLKEWTWCGTIKNKYGLYPPAWGDSAVPVQERVNDTCNIVHEHMDRVACGLVLAFEDTIGTRELNGKPLMPGVINGIKRPKSMPNMPLSQQIFQFKPEIDAQIYNYTDKLVYWMQLLVGTPPQIFGGSGDPHVETFGGQKQQLNTAMGKLNLPWDNTREENARAAEIAVTCAAQNMNEDWFEVVTDDSKEDYKNQYVYMDDMRGSIHAYPETDQGFPMSHEEIKDFWMQLIEFASSGKNPFANAILDEPANQDQAAIWIGVPGLVVPGQRMRRKTMQIIDRLMQEEPQEQEVPAPNPAGPGAPPVPQKVVVPSIQPDQSVDNLPIAVAVIQEWCQEHWEMAYEKPQQWANLMAYLKMCVQMNKFKQAQDAQAQQPQGKPEAAQVQ